MTYKPAPMEVSHLWFADGTIVIRAEDKLFCLHAGLLSARSDVFKQIIENKNEGNETQGIRVGLDISGLPLITLQDSGKDAQNSFTALYDPGFFEAPPANAIIDQVLGILKLATKYQVKPLRRRALSHLNLSFPLTLKAWDERAHYATLSMRREAMSRSIPYHSTFEGAVAIVNIAKAVNALWLLPAALYECCTYDPDVFLTNPVWDDGVSMTEELKKAIVIGAFKHREATRAVLRFLVTDPSEQCEQPYQCLEIKRKCDEIHAGSFPMNDPLSIWDNEDWDAFLDGLCSSCSQMCWNTHEEARQTFWNELPQKTYGLEQIWSNLKNMHDVEMSTFLD